MPHTLSQYPIHLGLGAQATTQPEFTGAMAWYDDYVKRHASDGVEGRLVSMHSFSESWTMWEMHPKGAEVVICTAGVLTLLQEQSEGQEPRVLRTVLKAGEYAINQPGVWHTMDIDDGVSATAVFVTAGVGTEHRPR